jgi:hypothetical protein
LLWHDEILLPYLPETQAADISLQAAAYSTLSKSCQKLPDFSRLK